MKFRSLNEPKKIVIVNQAVNYLTIGFANEFIKDNWEVGLITGSIHSQGESLSSRVRVSLINRFSERSLLNKLCNWSIALVRSLHLLLVQYKGYHILYISNPPMIYWLSLFLREKFSIMIWDVYPDTLRIFNIQRTNLIYRFWRWINRIVFRKAERLLTIGTRISQSLEQYVDRSKITIVPLWSTFNKDHVVQDKENDFITEHSLSDKFVVQYSGNIGLTHDINVIFDLAQVLKDQTNVVFQIIGRGYRSMGIQNKIITGGFNNVHFLEFQSDDRFANSLSAADLGVVILDSRTAKGSVPSKTYNLMAFGKPILYIAAADSELYDYAHQYGNGKCYESSAIAEIASFIQRISTDEAYYNQLSRNSHCAADYFQRKNARVLVDQFN
ncbi:MAG: glycosyltransferase family 4 protein [Saprospiraceae bacterium]|nr:glycosyltransferase family 4 protein [Saprospiraceae bacterium]